MTAGNGEVVRVTTESPFRQTEMTEFMRRMIVTLDGLWFMNVLQALGPEKAMELDIRVFITQFKLATRAWRQILRLDGQSVDDKIAVFQAMAHLYGHKFEVVTTANTVTMRLRECAFYENLRRAGRTATHDCRQLCRAIAEPWFREIEPRSPGQGSVDLTLPIGGDHCDWTVPQPV